MPVFKKVPSSIEPRNSQFPAFVKRFNLYMSNRGITDKEVIYMDFMQQCYPGEAKSLVRGLKKRLKRFPTLMEIAAELMEECHPRSLRDAHFAKLRVPWKKLKNKKVKKLAKYISYFKHHYSCSDTHVVAKRGPDLFVRGIGEPFSGYLIGQFGAEAMKAGKVSMKQLYDKAKSYDRTVRIEDSSDEEVSSGISSEDDESGESDESTESQSTKKNKKKKKSKSSSTAKLNNHKVVTDSDESLRRYSQSLHDKGFRRLEDQHQELKQQHDDLVLRMQGLASTFQHTLTHGQPPMGVPDYPTYPVLYHDPISGEAFPPMDYDTGVSYEDFLDYDPNIQVDTDEQSADLQYTNVHQGGTSQGRPTTRGGYGGTQGPPGRSQGRFRGRVQRLPMPYSHQPYRDPRPRRPTFDAPTTQPNHPMKVMTPVSDKTKEKEGSKVEEATNPPPGNTVPLSPRSTPTPTGGVQGNFGRPPVLCYNCHQYGHIAPYCPFNSAQVQYTYSQQCATPPLLLNLNLHSKKVQGHLIEMNGTLEGVEIRFLIDEGSSITLLTESSFQRISIALGSNMSITPLDKQINVQVGNGSHVVVRDGAELSGIIDDRPMKFLFCRFNPPIEPFQCLIGRDFMQHFGIECVSCLDPEGKLEKHLIQRNIRWMKDNYMIYQRYQGIPWSEDLQDRQVIDSIFASTNIIKTKGTKGSGPAKVWRLNPRLTSWIQSNKHYSCTTHCFADADRNIGIPESLSTKDSWKISWKGKKCLLTPDFRHISEVLKKVIADRAEVTMIVPVWVSKPWWKTLMSLLSIPPFKVIRKASNFLKGNLAYGVPRWHAILVRLHGKYHKLPAFSKKELEQWTATLKDWNKDLSDRDGTRTAPGLPRLLIKPDRLDIRAKVQCFKYDPDEAIINEVPKVLTTRFEPLNDLSMEDPPNDSEEEQLPELSPKEESINQLVSMLCHTGKMNSTDDDWEALQGLNVVWDSDVHSPFRQKVFDDIQHTIDSLDQSFITSSNADEELCHKTNKSQEPSLGMYTDEEMQNMNENSVERAEPLSLLLNSYAAQTFSGIASDDWTSNDEDVPVDELEDRAMFDLRPKSEDQKKTESKLEELIVDFEAQDGVAIAHVDRLKELIKQYRSCFATGLSEIGICNLREASLEVSEGPPITHRPYSMSKLEEDEMWKMIQKLLKAGLIRRSHSKWAAPAMMVMTNPQRPKMCCNYQRLNKRLIKESGVFPLTKTIFDDLGGKRYQNSVDLMKGFWQIKLNSFEDEEKTAFVCKWGCFAWKVMPLGLKMLQLYFSPQQSNLYWIFQT